MENDGRLAREGIPALFDLSKSAYAALFMTAVWPWDALGGIETFIRSLLAAAGGPAILSPVPEGTIVEGEVWIGPDCRIEPGAYIRGPAWIGRGSEIRQGAYLRGAVLSGDGAVLGHCSEFKNCVLLEGAQAPHFNYVGDSVLGLGAHIGAGVILSNLRLDKASVRVRLQPPGSQGSLGSQGSQGSQVAGNSGKVSDVRSDIPSGEWVDTGLRKFGAILGDHCEVGCNSVLNPGTVLGERCTVMPLSRVRGLWPAGSRIAG
ncbi:MAG: hypothetical protein WAZ99_03140 [Rectinemataceae bacterium]